MRFLCVLENLEIAFDVLRVIMWMSVQSLLKRIQILAILHLDPNRPGCFGEAKIEARRALGKGIVLTTCFI